MSVHSRTAAVLLAASLAAALVIFAQGQGGGQTPQQGGQGQAQTPAQPTQPPGAITGTVVNAKTGEALRKVLLTVRPSGKGGTPASASSDNAGAFRINGVDPGTYTLTGDRTGFVRGAYGEDRPGGTPRTM